MKCIFCENPNSIISYETCCTGCERLTLEDIQDLTFEDMKDILKETEQKIFNKLNEKT